MTDAKLLAEKKQRKRERNRNAENHAALLAAVGEGATLLARVNRRISLYPELKALGIHYSRRHLDRLEMEGAFPKRVALGEGRVGWITDEIIAHVDKQIESRSLAAGTLGSGDFCRRAKPARVTPRRAATDAATAKGKRNTKAVPRRSAQQPQAP